MPSPMLAPRRANPADLPRFVGHQPLEKPSKAGFCHELFLFETAEIGKLVEFEVVVFRQPPIWMMCFCNDHVAKNTLSGIATLEY